MGMIKDLVREKKQYRASIANNSEAVFTDKCLLAAIRTLLLKNADKDLYYAI